MIGRPRKGIPGVAARTMFLTRILTAAHSRLRSPDTVKNRLAFARVRMLRVLQSQIDSYRAQIEKLLNSIPIMISSAHCSARDPRSPRDYWARSARTARALKIPPPCSVWRKQLLSAIRVDSPQGLYSATLQQAAPSRCTFLANLSRQSCPWAAVYYQQLRTRGKSHAFFSLTATYVHSFDVSSLESGS
jgi:hypothetical protein